MALSRKKFFLINCIVGITCIATAASIGAYTFGSSLIEYNKYLKEYDANEKAILAKTTKTPKNVFIDNDYVSYENDGFTIKDSKSSYDYRFTCLASEAKFSSSPNSETYAKSEVNDYTSPYGTNVGNIGNSGGGGIEFAFDVEYGCYADIDLVLASALYNPEVQGNSAIEGLTKCIDITLNNVKINADEITLPVNNAGDWFNFQHLIFQDLHLQTGTNVLKLETRLAHPYHAGEFIFPNVSRIHVLADQPFAGPHLSVNAESAFIIKNADDEHYLSLSGTAIGYEKEQLMMDLCLANQTYNKIDKSKFYIDIVDNRFVMNVSLDNMEKGTYYPHFYVDGELLNSGHKDGRIMVNNMSSHYSGETIYQKVGNYTLSYIGKQLTLTIN